MSEHTPSPWDFHTTSAGTHAVTADDRQIHIATFGWSGSSDTDTSVANGVLAAAAPDLLAACEAMLDASDGAFEDCDCGECETVRQATAAIAKARGE